MMFCQHMCDQAVRQNLTLLTLKKIRAIFGEKEKSYSFTLPCSQKSPYIQRDNILKIYYINSPLGLLSLWRKPNRQKLHIRLLNFNLCSLFFQRERLYFFWFQIQISRSGLLLLIKQILG